MAQYSALADERETVDCFLAFHETKESPKKMQKLVTLGRESKHVPQSSYEKPKL